MGHYLQDQRGFTLAELLVVLVLVILVAALVLPNLLRSQIAADETAAIESLAKINKAEVQYQTAYPAVGFAPSLESLGPGSADGKCVGRTPAHACLLEPKLANAADPAHALAGYWFSSVPTTHDAGGAATGYVAGTAAAAFNKGGVRDFCSLEDAVIRYRVPKANSTPATLTSQCATMTILQ